MEPYVFELVSEGLLATMYMTVIATLFAYLLGLPLGILLYTTQADGLRSMPTLYRTLDTVTNVLRSVPFLILMIFVMPFTRMLVGKAIGSTAAIVPLVIAAAPMVARLVEGSLKEVGKGVVEAAQSMGASDWRIIRTVLLGESLPSLINGAAIAITTILGYSAMAGAVGGGGLGDIAIQYGHIRKDRILMWITIIILIIIVQVFQLVGSEISKRIDKRK